ncbi:MAG: hypothetical protein IT372_18800, partial [Polyangiaceae bacterium]|nr:hypothetical protein [Polyangiaceae bacterium]
APWRRAAGGASPAPGAPEIGERAALEEAAADAAASAAVAVDAATAGGPERFQSWTTPTPADVARAVAATRGGASELGREGGPGGASELWRGRGGASELWQRRGDLAER